MTFNVLTLFPEMIMDGVSHSVLGRAVKSGIVKVNCVNIRDFAVNKHGQVDDAPYGGGAGMVMMAPPVYDAYRSLLGGCEPDASADGAYLGEPAVSAAGTQPGICGGETDAEGFVALPTPRVVFLSPQGRVFDQKMAEEFSKLDGLVLLCGHYEGLDERIIEEIVTDEVSIGDYVLTGGEPAALVFIDAVSRLVPGVLGKEESHRDESFSDGLLEYPQYTRPPVFMGRAVPEVLLSGNHGQIDKWRREESLKRTERKRPDLIG